VPPEGFNPQPGWQPDPSWPPPPPGWQLWIPDPSVPDAPKQGTNGFAVAALIFGILGGLLGIVFGIVALVQLRRRRQGGKGMAITGLSLAGCWIVLIVIGAVGAALHPAPAGNVRHRHSISVFALQVGDCFDNPSQAQAALGVNDVTAMPCTQAHNAQVFAQYRLKGSSVDYPGSSTVLHEVTKGCNSRVSGALNSAAITKQMTLHFLFPQLSGWMQGQRKVVCFVQNPKSNLTSSLLAG
jgi:hypothetical protein